MMMMMMMTLFKQIAHSATRQVFIADLYVCMYITKLHQVYIKIRHKTKLRYCR